MMVSVTSAADLGSVWPVRVAVMRSSQEGLLVSFLVSFFGVLALVLVVLGARGFSLQRRQRQQAEWGRQAEWRWRGRPEGWGL